jgi:transposase
MARRIIEAAKRTVGVVHKQPALGIKISILAKRIATLQATIRDLDKQITALFNSLSCKPCGFPVGRAPSLAAILSEIGDVHRYPTLKKFLSHLGWCSQSFQTGNYWMLSIFAVQFVPRYREYFQRRVSESKTKMHIIVAVGRKLLSITRASSGAWSRWLTLKPRCPALTKILRWLT